MIRITCLIFGFQLSYLAVFFYFIPSASFQGMDSGEKSFVGHALEWITCL